MKRLCLILFAAALAACNPPVDTTPGAFESFDVSNMTGPICSFGKTSEAAEAYFGAHTDDGGRAFVRFKGETIKLAAVEDIDVDESGAISALYFAIDYPDWDIVLQGQDIGTANMPPTYNVTVSLIQGEAIVATAQNLTGQCSL